MRTFLDRAGRWDDLPRWRRALQLTLAAVVTLLVSEWTSHWLAGTGVLFANTLLTSDIITKEAIRILVNNLVFGKTVNRTYDKRFSQEGAKNGDTIRVRKPPRYLGRSGAAMSAEAIGETFVNVAMEEEFGVDIEVSNYDLTLSLDNFSEKVLSPGVARIANYIDQKCLQKAALTIPYVVGTPGTIPNALLTYGLAATKLDDNAAPQDEQRYITVSSLMQAYIVDAAKGLFQAAADIAMQYRKGQMGTFSGFRWQMDQNIYTHTVGALGGAPQVSGAGQSGASLATKGWTAAAAARLARGDVMTLAGSNHINPASYQSTGQLQQFLVTSAFSSAADGTGSVNIDPPITVAGSAQTVDASPANNATITVLGAASTQTPQGIAHHRDCIALVMADLPMPKGKDMAGRMSDEQLGLSIRFVRDFETRTGQWLTRLDVIFGVAALRSDALGCRIAS